jgi:hypothetical protein
LEITQLAHSELVELEAVEMVLKTQLMAHLVQRTLVVEVAVLVALVLTEVVE